MRHHETSACLCLSISTASEHHWWAQSKNMLVINGRYALSVALKLPCAGSTPAAMADTLTTGKRIEHQHQHERPGSPSCTDSSYFFEKFSVERFEMKTCLRDWVINKTCIWREKKKTICDILAHDGWGGNTARNVHYLYHRNTPVMAHQNNSKIILKSNAAAFKRNFGTTFEYNTLIRTKAKLPI